MGHKSKKSLIYQVAENLKSKLAISESKHNDKINGIDSRNKIYSFGTYNAYLQQSVQFVKWCKTKHKCKTLDECKQYADEYLKLNIDKGMSPYTLKLHTDCCTLQALFLQFNQLHSYTSKKTKTYHPKQKYKHKMYY